MLNIYSETDAETCRSLWEECIPSMYLTDLWEVRACFHRHYQRDLFFVVAKEAGRVVGLLPLAWIPERHYYGYFPGEVWGGKTWLEKNRFIARDSEVLAGMVCWLKKQEIPFHARYLLQDTSLVSGDAAVDEIGYLFCPPSMSYEIGNYFALFSRKSQKAIHREVENFQKRDLSFRFDELTDIDLMVQMNISRFGAGSYFADSRFTEGFRDLASFLRGHGWLRMTAAIVEGQPAAVDMGCIHNGFYTLLAGGTHADFPGIAKVINLHHMKKACEERFQEVDFLCGDFSWKKLFHLLPRPLYLVSNLLEEHHGKCQESAGCRDDGGLCESIK